MRHSRFSIATAAAIALTISLLGAAPAQASSSGPGAPATAAATPTTVKQGKLAVTVVAPKGVPATAVAARGSKRFSIAKTTSGTSKAVKKTAVAGTWKVTAKQVTYNGRVYVPSPRVKTVTVKAGKTTSVKVTYRLAKTAAKLKVTKVSTSGLAVSFTKPTATTPIRIRYAAGTKAPAKVTSGKFVRVATRATKVSIGKLTPGKTYSVSLFTKVGRQWVGPLSVTAGTLAKKNPKTITSSFVAEPDAAIFTAADKVPATVVSGKVQATLPTTEAPVVGQPVVLPISSALPGGFIGKVSAVGADGQTVTLKPAAVTDAFDFLDVSVPDLATAGTERRIPAAPYTMGLGTRGAETTIGTCSKELHVSNPVFTSAGSFSLKVRTAAAGFVEYPLGVSMDTKVNITGLVKIGVKFEGEAKCALTLPGIKRTFMAGPVPLALAFGPDVSVEAKGEAGATGIGASVSAGFEGSAYLPLPGGGKYKGSAKPLYEEKWLEPSVTAEGSVTAKVGGKFSFGPGVSTDVAGATAGISGALYPYTLKADITASAATGEEPSFCLGLHNGGQVNLGVAAKAWVGDWKAEAEYTFINHTWDYGTASFPIGCNDRWKTVATGADVGCGIRNAGELWCWGGNNRGQLGLGDTTPRSTPTRIGTAQNWTSVAMGMVHACGIRGDAVAGGQLYCWGAGDVRDRLTPTRQGTHSDWTSVTADEQRTCGIRAGGELWCWNRDFDASASRVGTSTDWTDITLGLDHQCGIRGAGQLWCWGDDSAGQLGTGTTSTTPKPQPVRVGTAGDWTRLSAGVRFTCGTRGEGSLWCWGNNTFGQLGIGNNKGARVTAPARVGSATGWTSIDSASNSTCGIRVGELWCWGAGSWRVPTSDPHAPSRVGTASDWDVVVSGDSSIFAIKGGELWGWGYNRYDLFGLTDQNAVRLTPMKIG